MSIDLRIIGYTQYGRSKIRHLVFMYHQDTFEQGFEETAVPNMVTAILADYRSFDTLGEVTVIFTAAMAVLLILRLRPENES